MIRFSRPQLSPRRTRAPSSRFASQTAWFPIAGLAAIVFIGNWANGPATALGNLMRHQADEPSVGAPRMIEEIFIPGSLLQARPLVDERQPIVVRIVNAFPQGTLGYRYQLVYSGYEPGAFDLRDYLERVDGSSVDDLPAIPVRIRSLLPTGQIEPNALSVGQIPRFGGYRQWLIVAIILWFAGLAAILVLGRRSTVANSAGEKSLSLAELLRPRIQAALDNQLDARQFAELERMLIAAWQRRLGLTDIEPSQVVGHLRRHPQAAPLMRALEHWMHDPAHDRSVDLNSLLEPLGQLSVVPSAEWDGRSAVDDRVQSESGTSRA